MTTTVAKANHETWRRPLLAAILLMALALRLRGIDFGLPALLDPDEPIFVLLGLKLLKEHTLNPGWFGHPGTTTIYSLAVVEAGVFLIGHLTGRFPDASAFTWTLYHDPGVVFLPGRLVMLASALLVVFLTYRLAHTLFETRVALLSAALLAIDPIHIRYSQIIRTDMQASIFVMLTLLAAVRIARGERGGYIMAGIWLGIGCATKWPSVTVAAGVAGAALLRLWRDPAERGAVLRGLASFAITSIVICIAVSPYLVLDFQTVATNLHGEERAIHLGATGYGLFGNLRWYVDTPFQEALGAGGVVLAFAGLVWGGFRRPIFGCVVGAAVFAFLVSISVQHLAWERWVVPLLPLMTISAAFVIVRSIAWLRHRIPAAALPAGLGLGLLTSLPPLALGDAQAAERATDTRRLASAWARAHVPAGSSVAIEYLALDTLSAPWRFLFPMGDRGCVDGRALLGQRVSVSAVGSWRQSRPIVDFGGIPAEKAATCRADYLVTADYDRYLAEAGRFPAEVASYRRIAAGGQTVAVFRPHAGVIGGPVVRIVRIGR